ncbi:MAG: hypothetical protein KGD66_08330 [Candidatus Lokiarchaeota archaeon]|nr:hypothetical protein [Candidatus Lokiarchaeota archaeon]
MVYFQVSRLGFNCGKDKEECSFYPDHCKECVKAYIAKIGFDTSQNIKISMMDSEEEQIKMQQSLIWYKFMDVLNIKLVILQTKDSGLLILNYPVSGSNINVDLLIGFMQANITFSSSGSLENKSDISNHKFYELQYDNFNLLLKNGNFIRICLVLDGNASESLKQKVAEFLHEYEKKYYQKIERLLKIGMLNFDDTIDFIVEAFNIKLVFPMILSHMISPGDLELINKNLIQKAIIDFANELLNSKNFFFINNLIDKVQQVVKSHPSIILYEIYQLLERNIIIPSKIESLVVEVRKFQDTRAKRIANNELISSILANDDAINNLKEKARTLDVEEAKKLMENFVKKGENAEKALIYKEAQKEYEKALYLATGFNFETNIGKISFIILELDKKIKALEIGFNLETGEKAEKKKDYINAIQSFQHAIEFLGDIGSANENASKIKKLEKRILSLQKHV